MEHFTEEIDNIIFLSYFMLKLKNLMHNNITLKKLFTDELKKIYNDLEKLDIELYVNDNKHNINDHKYELVRLTTILHTFMIPVQGDFLINIYNKSEFPVKFGLYINTTLISQHELKPRESVYPLYNKAILPLYTLNSGVRLIFYDHLSSNDRRKIGFVYRNLDEINRSFIRINSRNINYYIIQNNICYIIENGFYTEYNIENIQNYLNENDVCFDKSIMQFCIEI
jgi:hypothetical protein